MKDKRELIRVVRGTDGEISIDTTGRKNGRGAYICRSAECLAKAIKNKGLEKSLKAAIPEKVSESLKKEMERLDKQ